MRFVPFDRHAADIGDPALDAEHRGQIELMNRVGETITSGSAPTDIAFEIGKLAGYLDVHFVSEMIRMREEAYPDYAAHQAEHDHAMTMLETLRTRCAAGDESAMLEALRALDGWLVAHIRRSDRAFVEFVTREGSA